MKTMHKSKIIKESIPFIIVIIIALFILPVTGTSINNNSAKWLLRANRVLHGQGLGWRAHDIGTAYGVPFLIILVSGYKLLGKSVRSASLATRIFFALEIILIYLLGRIFYSQAVGLLSSGLVITSWGINYVASFIDADIILPFFILLFILFFYITLIRTHPSWAVFAGISLILALMVNESAVVWLGLPFVMFLLAPKGKRWEYGKSCLWIIGTMVIFLVVWSIYMLIANASYSSIFDAVRFQYSQVAGGITGATNQSFVHWTYLLTTSMPSAVFEYCQTYLAKMTPLNALMILGWLIVLIRGIISKKISDIILTASIVCCLPLMYLTPERGLRIGQTSIVYMILYISLATFVVSCISFFIKYGGKYTILDSTIKKNPKLINNLLIVFVGFFLISAQLFPKSDSTWKLWTESKHSLSIFSSKPFKVYGRFTIEQQQAVEWLKKNTLKNAKIIADGYIHEALDFFEVADYQIPLFHPKQGISIALESIKKRDDNTRPLFLTTHSNFATGTQRHRLIWPILEEDIVTALKKENPDYLVISGKGLFLGAYFDQAEWACLKFDNQAARIYEIHLDRFESVQFENIGVNETINEHIVWLEKNYPDEYLLFTEKIEALGLTIDDLKNSPLRFPRGQIY